MTIVDNIKRLTDAKEAIKQSLIDKGISVPDDALLDEFPAAIDEAELYGPLYNDLYNMRTINGTNMAGLFSYCTASELDLSNLDTSKATNMSYMFSCCSSAVNIDGWDTNKVTDMSYMFNFFSDSIDISKLDTSSVTNATYMFGSANTDNIILTGLNFPSATKLDNMFSGAKGTTIDLSSWDISNITNMNSMFSSADYKRIDLTGWKTTNVTNMYYMFNRYASPLVELIIPDWDMTNVTSSNKFMDPSYMSKLKLIDLSRSNDTTITKIASFLPTRTATTYGDVIVPSNTSQEAYDTLIAKYWRPIGASLTPAPTSIEIVSELDEIVLGMNNSTKVYLCNHDPWNADESKVELVMVSDESIATMEGYKITSTGVIGDILLEARIIDTQEVIATKIIPVSKTDSYPNVVKFRLASTPTSSSYTVITVNGSNKKSSDLTYDRITGVCSYDAGVPITSIKFNSYLGEIVKLNTSNITSTTSMFDNCSDLISLDLSNWDTSNVTDMGYMFYNCTSLTSLDISNFDTSNVTRMIYMFNNCTSLHTLRLDNCNNDTINKIITSSGFPTNAIDGVIRTIYCKESEANGLTPPTNWVFSFIEE